MVASRVSLIVAVGPGGVIGHDGELPWRLPADLAHFKRTTLGHPVIMGRKTFDSIGRPLPERRNIVLTRSPDRLPAGVEGAEDPEAALALCADAAEVFVIGGAEVYRLFLELADRIVLTEVEGTFPGDTFFPEFDRARWREVSREEHEPDQRNAHPYRFLELVREPARG